MRTDHKPLKNLMEFITEDRNVHYWRVYNCKIEYIEGKKNVSGDLLLLIPHNCSGHNCDHRGDSSRPDINDKTFEINLINSSNINATAYAQ